jgi:hypothetical protein
MSTVSNDPMMRRSMVGPERGQWLGRLEVMRRLYGLNECAELQWRTFINLIAGQAGAASAIWGRRPASNLPRKDDDTCESAEQNRRYGNHRGSNGAIETKEIVRA